MPHPRTLPRPPLRLPVMGTLLALSLLIAVGAPQVLAAKSSKRVAAEAENATLGKTVLTTTKGRTLYSLSVEKNGKFICTASCLSVWHPLRVPAGVRPTGPVKLGTIERPEGGTQVTYKGRPLYRFGGDTKAGQANGEGIKDVGTWHAASPPREAAEPAPQPQPQPQPENPYPYSGVFRRRLPNAERPWRAPAGSVLAPLAFVVANLLILWSGWDTVWRLGVAILIGYVILALTRIFNLNPRSPQLDLKAASWLPVYLLGMGAIVYLSDFGPMTNPVFPLWWDMAVVAIFSAIVFFWAMAVALPTERIEEMIGDVVLPEEEDAAANEALARDV